MKEWYNCCFYWFRQSRWLCCLCFFFWLQVHNDIITHFYYNSKFKIRFSFPESHEREEVKTAELIQKRLFCPTERWKLYFNCTFNLDYSLDLINWSIDHIYIIRSFVLLLLKAPPTASIWKWLCYEFDIIFVVNIGVIS